MPRPAPGRLPRTARDGAAAVYLPACINRMFGPSRRDGDTWLPQALVDVSARAGLPVWIPDDAAGVCCATPFSSKGFHDAHVAMGKRLADALQRWSDGGRLPVVIDATSCAHGAAEHVPEGVELLDAVSWAHDRLLPRLEVRAPVASATVHPTCAARHLGLSSAMEGLARALAQDVVVPAAASCCGMAGDRGMLHPELVASATRDEAAEVRDAPTAAYVSANRTCEMALERSTGQPYVSLIQLLERTTRG